jgi:hypothetical protein
VAGEAGVTLRWEAVPGEVAAAFRSVSEVLAGSDFYLAGGTALALLEGHRVSVDLDLFSATLGETERLIAQLGRQLPVVVTSTAPRTLYVELAGVQVSFFGYDYPLVGPLVTIEGPLLPLASVLDIGAMKLAEIARRGARKDFVDLWVVARGGHRLTELLEAYRRKFGARDIGHVARSLVDFDDAEAEPPLPTLSGIEWAEVKADLARWVGELFQ